MERFVHNGDVMPRYRADADVRLDDGFSPDWVKDLILTEVRLDTATPEGTIEAAYRLLDHYREMGVNGLWLTPVYDKGETGNGYGSLGPHTIAPSLTGTADYDAGWRVLRDFVDEAHRQDIRIFLDAVTWGTVNEAPLMKEHPDFYANQETWGGQRFQFVDTPWQKWYFDQMMRLVMEVGVDGFRCDCEPAYTGYPLFKAVREHCLELGRKIAVFSEDQNERLGTYDFEQFGVMQTLYEWGVDKQVANPRNHYLGAYNLVDSVKSGEGIGSRFSQIHGRGGSYRFYSYNTCCHDYGKTTVDDNLLAIGYQAVFAPFIPILWMGDEMMRISHNGPNCLYFQPVDWALLDEPENRRFYETVKRYIRIRRQYPEIFSCFPPNHRDANICRVEADGGLQAYARYAGRRGVLVVPNNTGAPGNVTAVVPLAAMGLDPRASVRCSDLLTGRPISAHGVGRLLLPVIDREMAVVLVEQP